MASKVLIVYATKYGATREIAQKIEEVLRQEGLQTDFHPVDGISDLSKYDAVVMGSAVYVGQWRKEAVAFLEDNEEELAQRKVWFFSSGPLGEGDPVELMNGWRFPEAQQAIADRIHAQDIAFFHGKLDMKKLNLAEKLMVKGIKAPVGDFRDWDLITSWAEKVSNALKEGSA